MSRRGRPPGQKEPEVFAKEPYFSENSTESLDNDLPFIVIPAGKPLDYIDESGVLVTTFIQEPMLPLNQVAFSVARRGKIYQLVKIPYSSELLMPGQPEVIFESTDRWEVQSQFVFHTEEAFLVVEDL